MRIHSMNTRINTSLNRGHQSPPGDTRYQFSPLYVRAWRRLVFMPPTYAVALFNLSKWIASGAKCDESFPTRREMAEFIWQSTLSMGHMRMGWYWTTDEVIASLKEGCE